MQRSAPKARGRGCRIGPAGAPTADLLAVDVEVDAVDAEAAVGGVGVRADDAAVPGAVGERRRRHARASVGRPEVAQPDADAQHLEHVGVGAGDAPAGTAVRAYSDGPNWATPGGISTSVSAAAAVSAQRRRRPHRAGRAVQQPGVDAGIGGAVPHRDAAAEDGRAGRRREDEVGAVERRDRDVRRGERGEHAARPAEVAGRAAPHAAKPAPTAARRPVWSAAGRTGRRGSRPRGQAVPSSAGEGPEHGEGKDSSHVPRLPCGGRAGLCRNVTNHARTAPRPIRCGRARPCRLASRDRDRGDHLHAVRAAEPARSRTAPSTSCCASSRT